MPNFLGADFALESVTQLSLAVIRVRFTQDPLAASSGGIHDSLNIAQYTLAGPGVNAVQFAAPVSGDPQSIDLSLVAPLIPGTWTLQVSGNVQTGTGRPLQPPVALAFNCTLTADTEGVNPGAINDDPERVIRKHLNPALKGKAWNAIIAAIAAGDRTVWNQSKYAFDQLFKSSASGVYLDRRASDDGVVKPAGIGMSDDLFRQYAIKTTTAKLTQESMLDVLEIFYGPDSVRAYAETSLPEPYALESSDDLKVLLDERDSVTVTFQQADFGRINVALAIEVAAVLTRAFRLNGLKAWAVAITDPSTGQKRVRIYSGSKGLGSSVRVTGGFAQEHLHFPDAIDIYGGQTVTGADGYNWVVTNPRPGVTRFTLTAVSPKVDLSVMRPGDWVIIGVDMGALALTNTYSVTDVNITYSGGNKVQWFEIGVDLNSNGTYLQGSNRALVCFRPSRATIQRGSNRTVVVAQTTDRTVDVVVPATTQAVGRGVKTAAYLKQRTPLTLSSLSRNLNGLVTVNTTGNHGLTAGQQIWIDDAHADVPAVPTVTAGTIGTPGTTDYSQASIWSLIQSPTITNVVEHKMVKLLDGRVLLLGGLYVDNLGNENPENATSLFSILSTSTYPGGETQYQYRWDTGASLPYNAPRAGGALISKGPRAGTVLVSGGSYVSAPGVVTTTNNTAIYFPNASSGVWIAGPNMSVSRGQHVCVTYNDGAAFDKILMAGGALDRTTSTNAADIWNSSTNAISATGALGTARTDAQGVGFSAGTSSYTGNPVYALVVGGRQLGGSGYAEVKLSGQLLSSCEMFNGTVWEYGGAMTYARTGHRLTKLPDGRVLVTGGWGYIDGHAAVGDYLKQAEIFDPKTSRWSPAGQMNEARAFHFAEYLASKNCVVVGFGENGTGNKLTTVEYLDLATMTWRYMPTKSVGGVPYSIHTDTVTPFGVKAVVLNNGGILAYGGYTVSGQTPYPQVFVPGSDAYTAGGLNGMFTVASIPSPTQFTFQSDNKSYTSLGNTTLAAMGLYPVKAITDTANPGPYLFDPLHSPSVTNTIGTTTQDLIEGQSYRTLDVDDSTVFPNEEGWLCLDFGHDGVEAPVRYLGRYSPTALLLDYSYVFKQSHKVLGFTVSLASRAGGTTTLTLNLNQGVSDHGLQVGQTIYFKVVGAAGFTAGYKTLTGRTATTISFTDAGGNTSATNPGTIVVSGPTVTLLKDKNALTPPIDPLGAFYVTASPAGRVAAISTLENTVGAGIEIHTTIEYPGDYGLGNEGYPVTGLKLSDKVAVWGSDDLDTEIEDIREED